MTPVHTTMTTFFFFLGIFIQVSIYWNKKPYHWHNFFLFFAIFVESTPILGECDISQPRFFFFFFCVWNKPRGIHGVHIFLLRCGYTTTSGLHWVTLALLIKMNVSKKLYVKCSNYLVNWKPTRIFNGKAFIQALYP